MCIENISNDLLLRLESRTNELLTKVCKGKITCDKCKHKTLCDKWSLLYTAVEERGIKRQLQEYEKR